MQLHLYTILYATKKTFRKGIHKSPAGHKPKGTVILFHTNKYVQVGLGCLYILISAWQNNNLNGSNVT